MRQYERQNDNENHDANGDTGEHDEFGQFTEYDTLQEVPPSRPPVLPSKDSESLPSTTDTNQPAPSNYEQKNGQPNTDAGPICTESHCEIRPTAYTASENGNLDAAIPTATVDGKFTGDSQASSDLQKDRSIPSVVPNTAENEIQQNIPTPTVDTVDDNPPPKTSLPPSEPSFIGTANITNEIEQEWRDLNEFDPYLQCPIDETTCSIINETYYKTAKPKTTNFTNVRVNTTRVQTPQTAPTSPPKSTPNTEPLPQKDSSPPKDKPETRVENSLSGDINKFSNLGMPLGSSPQTVSTIMNG